MYYLKITHTLDGVVGFSGAVTVPSPVSASLSFSLSANAAIAASLSFAPAAAAASAAAAAASSSFILNRIFYKYCLSVVDGIERVPIRYSLINAYKLMSNCNTFYSLIIFQTLIYVPRNLDNSLR
jgi:hypothetical protein